MSFGKTITLCTSAPIPQIGFGTWQAPPKEVENAVEIALRCGYRHIDLARIYGNQTGVAAALKKVVPSVVKREELFLTSKLWNCSHQPAEVEKDLDTTLKELDVDYLDLYLMHWPVAFAPGKALTPQHPQKSNQAELDLETSVADTWKAMVALPKSKVRAIGVSNFTLQNLRGIIAATGVVPAVLQIEAHPKLQQNELVAFCNEHNIHITAYSAFGNNDMGLPLLVENPVVKEVAQNLGVTGAQVLVGWAVHRGYSVIPKSVREERIKSNFIQVDLSKEDYEKICSIKGDKETRFNWPIHYKPLFWDIAIFKEPEEAEATHQVKLV